MTTKPHEHEYDPRYDELLYCLKCGGAEASLPSSCPGRQMTPDEDDLVAAGELDFQRTRNTLEYSWWKKALPLGPLNHKVTLTDAEMDAAGWVRKPSPFVPAPTPAVLPAMNEELVKVLGRPNFTCRELATLLRATGTMIPSKSEHEQAHVLHFLLSQYLIYGDAWAETSEAELHRRLSALEG